jgi:hypothetical protein
LEKPDAMEAAIFTLPFILLIRFFQKNTRSEEKIYFSCSLISGQVTNNRFTYPDNSENEKELMMLIVHDYNR